MIKGSRKTYRPLSELVTDALDDYGYGMHHRYRFTRWGIKYAEELGYDHLKDVVTVKLNLQPWKAVKLPDDYVDWVMVGIQSGDQIMAFTNDPDIALEHDIDENGVQVANSAPDYSEVGNYVSEGPNTYALPFLNLSNFGEDKGKLFGLMSKDNGLGYFTINRNKDVDEIQFRGDNIKADSKIYLMYISSVWNPKEETMIHPVAAEFIIAGIHKEHSRFKTGMSGLDKQLALDEFNRQYLRVLDHSWDLTAADVIDYLKAGYRLTPKLG